MRAASSGGSSGVAQSNSAWGRSVSPDRLGNASTPWPPPEVRASTVTRRPVPGRTWAFLVLSGLATGASWVCYFRALRLGEAAKVAPIDKLSVVLVALFAAAFLGERPSPPVWLGIAMIAGGAGLIAWRG